MRLSIHSVFFVIVFLSSCNNPPASIPNKKNLVVDIQPFDDIPTTDITFVYDHLKERLPLVNVNTVIAFPSSAYNYSRHRYRADSLINYLAAITPQEHVTIGLTNKDISTTKGTVNDWGVMGLGFQPGTACIASGFRLSKINRQMQLFKVAIHELGHTQGLAHCSVKTCFMRDAESRNPTDEETDFCENCKKKLRNKGLEL